MCRSRLIPIQDPYHAWIWTHPVLGLINIVHVLVDPESSLSAELTILDEHPTKVLLDQSGFNMPAWFPKKGFQGYVLQQPDAESRIYQICPWFANTIPRRKKAILFNSLFPTSFITKEEQES